MITAAAPLFLLISSVEPRVVLEAPVQYTPDEADWGTFDSKAVADNPLNADHSPDGVGWLGREDWTPWDGTAYSPVDHSHAAFRALLCPGGVVRGAYELFAAHQPFADVFHPTKAEVDRWHALALHHVRALVGYAEEEYRVRPDRCLHLRARWADERLRTRAWDTAEYPGTCTGSTNPHCGAGFLPSVADQWKYLEGDDGIASCGNRAGSEGLFSTAKSNIPWSIKWMRPFCQTLGSEGFWGGHTMPWFHRSEFGWSWWDLDRDDPNSNAGLRTKWAGPSGALKYEDPDVTRGRFTVHAEDVAPLPRFPGYQCAGIRWLGDEADATACYARAMGDGACGKRFLTYHDNGGCACYPPAVAACDAALVPGRGTWDLAPAASSFAGLSLDDGRALGGSALPYAGRVCPRILWKTLAGDAAHCLQRIVEGGYADCGRNFVTFNAHGGGCACYPPEQVTCARSETSPQSGRQTFALKVDPSYIPPTPQAPTMAPIMVPTMAPTKVEVPITSPTLHVLTMAPNRASIMAPTKAPTKEPTNEPTMSRTKAPTKVPTEAPTKALIEVPVTVPTNRTTTEPTKEPTKATTQGPTKAPTTESTEALLSVSVTPVSPTKAPTGPTGSDIPCYERGSRRFSRITKGGRERSTSCRNLAKETQSTIEDRCAADAGGRRYGAAREACPVTCHLCSGGCNEASTRPVYWRTRGGRVVTKECWWLTKKKKTWGSEKLKSICNKLAPEGHANGDVVCPITCESEACSTLQ